MVGGMGEVACPTVKEVKATTAAVNAVPVAEAGEANAITEVHAAPAAAAAKDAGEGGQSVAEGQKHPFLNRLAKRLRNSTTKILWEVSASLATAVAEGGVSPPAAPSKPSVWKRVKRFVRTVFSRRKGYTLLEEDDLDEA
ncbi:hypothetical protein AAFF_G00113280 [Aldrovandia affinis]|uniref:Uncharacterized protein n=1 Tax=Aldrovandia affinis TaxID=143900 RepID=A0AAD7RT18_9TELE|nr:hypothetical protein AAFF_G00113280 [Aldrovandia affinis]